MTQADVTNWVVGGLIATGLMFLLFRARAAFRDSPGWSVVARVCLLLVLYAGVAAVAAAAVWFVRTVPVIIGLFVLIAIRLRKRRFAGSGTAFGTARWAEVGELASAGMLRTGGVPVGLAPRVKFGDAVRFLRTAPWWASESVCRLLLAAAFRTRPLLTVHSGVHTVCYAPAGVGKTTGIVIPFLLSCSDSAVVIDIKGELHRATAAHRQASFGHRIVTLDPFNVVTERSDSLNPLAHIDPLHPHALDDIRKMAEALVVRSGNEKEPHFDDVAEMVIGAVAAFVAAVVQEKNLQSLADFVASPVGFDKATAAMLESDEYDGMLRRMGGQLASLADREKSSVISTANRHLRFLNTSAVRRVTSASTFDPRDLRQTTVYLIIPPDKLASLAGLLRAWLTVFIHGVVHSGLKLEGSVRFVIDEAAAVMGGRMEVIESAIAQLRGYGLKFLFMFQSQGQLKKVFPDGQDQTFHSLMDTRIYAGTNDPETAEGVSKMLGDATILTGSSNGGTSWSTNTDPHGLSSRSASGNDGYSTQEAGRNLLQAAEVLSLPSQTAVVFAKGVPPFTTHLVRHFEPGFKKLLKPASGKAVALRCIAVALLPVLVTGLILTVWVCPWMAPKARSPPSAVVAEPGKSGPPPKLTGRGDFTNGPPRMNGEIGKQQDRITHGRTPYPELPVRAEPTSPSHPFGGRR